MAFCIGVPEPLVPFVQTQLKTVPAKFENKLIVGKEAVDASGPEQVLYVVDAEVTLGKGFTVIVLEAVID
jgi:hypothetical protein